MAYELLLVCPLNLGKYPVLAWMLKFDVSVVNTHCAGGGAITVIPNQSAVGKDYVHFVFFSGHWVLQGRHSRFKDALDPETGITAIKMHLDGLYHRAFNRG